MLFVPLELLEPGMILGENVPSYNIYVPLLTAGQALSGRAIASLAERGVLGVYIESPLAEGVTPKSFFTPEKRLSLLEGIKSEFERARLAGTLPSPKVFEAMASEIVFSALQQESLLYNVITIRNYDDYTYSHSLYVGGIASLIGAHLKLPQQQLVSLATAGLLHDIGKLDISLGIVNKPSALSDEEFATMKEHPQLGVQRLSTNKKYQNFILRGVESHHEYYDGSGYPNNLAGKDIPLFGRILAIADVYDALSSARSYRPAWSPSRIIDYISSCSGTQFDPAILPAFLHSVVAYPVGTLIKLSNDWTGIVIKNTPDFILRPCVRVLSPPTEAGREIDLSETFFNVTVLGLLEKGDGVQLT